MRSSKSPKPGGILLSNGRKGPSRNARSQQKRTYVPKKKRLNLRKIEEFKFEMSEILDKLPPNVVGTIKGSIIAKADKIDINAALDFIHEKEEEGLLSKEDVRRLSKLLNHYSFYR